MRRRSEGEKFFRLDLVLALWPDYFFFRSGRFCDKYVGGCWRLGCLGDLGIKIDICMYVCGVGRWSRRYVYAIWVIFRAAM